MSVTISSEARGAIVLVTADGEAREARTYPDGSYACPFCSAAVMSPDGWAEMQRLNAECYARTGEAYTAEPYARYQAQTWEARGCPNPGCLMAQTAEGITAIRERNAEREAEQAWRKRNHELAMERIAESKAAQHTACDAARERCERDGTCFECWRHSTYGGTSTYRERFVHHRDPANCPQVRRYAR